MSVRRRSLFGLLLGLAVGFLATGGCFEAPRFAGPFRCQTVQECGGEENGWACDDGVCCQPLGSPSCPTLVLQGNVCPDGSNPKALFPDLDGDGYGNPREPKLSCGAPALVRLVETPFDCNDNPVANGFAEHPDASEECDGFDNDCDGVIDDGHVLKQFFLDRDGDGFGQPDAAVLACRKPAGNYEENGLDCEPGRADLNPDTVEACNGKDDNCSGEADEGVKPFWYRDADGDGFGTPNNKVLSCDRPDAGFVSNSLDCNDTRRAVSPEALDVCDGVDNNCAGGIDEEPDCGGPSDLLSNTAGLVHGAEDLNHTPVFGPALFRCQKGLPDSGPDLFATPVWAGSGANAHIFYVETPRSWDLTSRDGGDALGRGLAFSMKARVNNARPEADGGPFELSYQPLVYLCGADGGHARYVPTRPSTPSSLFKQSSGFVIHERMPFNEGNGWIVGGGSGVDLRAIKRVEIFVDLAQGPASSETSFALEFLSDAGGFGFR